jgi:hypothetical protein
MSECTGWNVLIGMTKLRAATFARSGTCECICLSVEFARHVRDGKIEGTAQFAASPMQRVEPGTPAKILSGHLPDHHLRVRVDVNRLRSEFQGVLKCFQQSEILGHIVVLAADPFGNFDLMSLRAVDYDSNARRPRIAQRATIDIGH